MNKRKYQTVYIICQHRSMIRHHGYGFSSTDEGSFFNGHGQIGPICFSEKAALDEIERIQKSRKQFKRLKLWIEPTKARVA